MSRSGFIALAGRPNVGKSTLANAIVGVKVAVVSDKPQTTRRALRGVATGPDWQLVLVDLPGVQRPRDVLTVSTLQDAADLGLSEAIFPVSARTGAGLPALVEHLVASLPPGPFYFAPAQHSDQSETLRLADLVREQVLARTRAEVPHAVEVEVQEIKHPRPDLV